MRSLRSFFLIASGLSLAAFAAQACSSDSGGGAAPGGDDAGLDATSSEGGTSDASSDTSQADSGAADSSTDAPIDAPRTCSQTPSDGGRAPILIAQGQSKPTGVAVDGTSIYWGNQGDGTIVKCPLAGCGGHAPEVIATGQSYPEQVTVQGGYVYWINFFGSLNRCPTSGCGDAGPYSFPGTSGAGFALDQNNVYWTDFNDGKVLACPSSGCTQPTVLYQGVKGLTYGVAVDATSVYVMNALSGQIYAVPLAGVPDGGSPRLIASSSDPSFAALGAGNLYWDSLAAGTSVMSLPASASVDSGVAPTTIAGNMPHAEGMAFDDVCGTIYWTANGVSTADGGRAGGGVFRCPAAGCGDASPEQFGADNMASFVAVDDGYAYWADNVGGNVWKIAK